MRPGLRFHMRMRAMHITLSKSVREQLELAKDPEADPKLLEALAFESPSFTVRGVVAGNPNTTLRGLQELFVAYTETVLANPAMELHLIQFPHFPQRFTTSTLKILAAKNCFEKRFLVDGPNTHWCLTGHNVTNRMGLQPYPDLFEYPCGIVRADPDGVWFPTLEKLAQGVYGVGWKWVRPSYTPTPCRSI